MTPIPLVLLLTSIPLAMGLVPRNRFYGLRVPFFNMKSDQIWYRSNRVFGTAQLIASAVWLTLDLTLPSPRLADALGWSVLFIAVMSAVVVYRRQASPAMSKT